MVNNRDTFMIFGYDQRCVLRWGGDVYNRPEQTEKDGQSGLEVRIKTETQI